MISCQTSEVVFECSFGSLNVLYVYIDKVHITMTYKKTYPHIIHGTFVWSSSLLWTSCFISLEGSPYIFHRQHLKASHLFKYVCVCDVSSRIYNIIILHAFLCVPKVQLFWLTYFLLFPQQILSFVFAFYKLYAMKRRHNHQFIYMLCAGMA